MRQLIAYKILDIILILSLRIGPEQTRIEMGRVLKLFFQGFLLTQSRVTSSSIPISKYLTAHPNQLQMSSSKNSSFKSAAKHRTSIAFAPISNQKPSTNAKDNLIPNSGTGLGVTGILEMVSKENLDDEANNSCEEYLKYSFDQTTNEIVGSSLKTNSGQAHKRVSSLGLTYKFRSQSIGLLSMSNEGYLGLFREKFGSYNVRFILYLKLKKTNRIHQT